jgi:hypothetical protein
MGQYTGIRTPGLNTTRLRQLAFSSYESRGRQDGYHIEDQPCAEQELVRHYA